ncbi:MAG: hypothetical protein ACRD0K_02105 [Egibacteraceae bacterium]
MAYVIRPAERASFKRCRRQWDMSSRARQSLERADALPRDLDLGEAIRDALAVYYFPGMWEWNRAIVLPLARSAFEKSVARQVGPDVDGAVEERALGLQLLESYFAWAPSADRFWPVRVETDFTANVPDPRASGHDLVSPEAGEVRYEGRIPMLVVDEADAYWLIEHRVVWDSWTDVDQLLLDEVGVAACWAWELFYMGMRVAGTITNELRVDLAQESGSAPAQRGTDGLVAEAAAVVGPGHRRMYAQAASEPVPGVIQEGDGPFRRTRIARGRAELDRAGEQLAWEALDMVDPELRVYPNPQPAHCRTCDCCGPCLALSAGEDPGPILAARYRPRPPERVEEGRLGGVTWGMSRGAMPMESRARERQRLPRPGGDHDA